MCSNAVDFRNAWIALTGSRGFKGSGFARERPAWRTTAVKREVSSGQAS